MQRRPLPQLPKINERTMTFSKSFVNYLDKEYIIFENLLRLNSLYHRGIVIKIRPGTEEKNLMKFISDNYENENIEHVDQIVDRKAYFLRFDVNTSYLVLFFVSARIKSQKLEALSRPFETVEDFIIRKGPSFGYAIFQ